MKRKRKIAKCYAEIEIFLATVNCVYHSEPENEIFKSEAFKKAQQIAETQNFKDWQKERNEQEHEKVLKFWEYWEQ